MKIIEDLYYGRISPYEMSISATPEYQKLKALADRNEDLLRESLSDGIQAWSKADDGCDERRVTAPIAPCVPM